MWPPREPHGIAAFGTTMPALATAKTWLAGLGADNREDRTAGPDRALLVTYAQALIDRLKHLDWQVWVRRDGISLRLRPSYRSCNHTDLRPEHHSKQARHRGSDCNIDEITHGKRPSFSPGDSFTS
jgi:hypothetical protein